MHRAIANRTGPRIFVACFFTGPLLDTAKIYGPIEELITEENPAVYRQVTISEYLTNFLSNALDTYRALDYYNV